MDLVRKNVPGVVPRLEVSCAQNFVVQAGVVSEDWVLNHLRFVHVYQFLELETD